MLAEQAKKRVFSPAVQRILRDMERQELGKPYPSWFQSVNKQEAYYYQFKKWFERNPAPYEVKYHDVAAHSHPHFTHPHHSIEYERTYRILNREENVPFQDFRDVCAERNNFDMFKDLGKLPYRFSSEMWQVRFQAMFDFDLFRGRAEWKQDLEKVALAHPTTRESSLSMIAGILEGGMEDELFERIIRRVCCYGDCSTRDQLLAGYDGGSVAKAYTNFGLVAHQLHAQVEPPQEHIAALELERKKILEMERRAQEAAERFGTVRAPFEIPDLSHRVNSRRRQSMDSFPESLMRVGIKLFESLKDRVTFDGEPLFTLLHDQYSFRAPSRVTGEVHYDFHMTDYIQLNPRLIKLLKVLGEGDPPKFPKALVENNRSAKWEHVQGGLPALVFTNEKIPGKVSTFYYSDKPELALHVPFMRTNNRTQTVALSRCEYPEVIDGLNALSNVKWGTNWSIVERMHRHAEENRIVGDITRSLASLEDVYDEMLLCAKHYGNTKSAPKRDMLGLPKILRAIKEDYVAFNSPEKFFSKQDYWEHFRKVYLDRKAWGKLRKEASVGFSKKLSSEASLEAARILNQSFSIPYNLDFRGRAYPIAKALTPIGDDFNRGILKFERELPLGHRGWFWLKVQLANQFGQDKQSFDNRAKWTDKNMQYILQSIPANEPRRRDSETRQSISLNQFWTHSKSPTQAYAACFEVACAMRNEVGGPEAYLCGLPVHMDGSCNGLQHYSAISRDEIGGKAVNLGNYAEPEDVYGLVAQDIKDTMDHYAYWWNRNRYNAKMAASMFTRELRKQKPNMPQMEFWDNKTGIVQGHRPYMKRFLRRMEIEEQLKRQDLARRKLSLEYRDKRSDLVERMLMFEDDPTVPLPEFAEYFTQEALDSRLRKSYNQVQSALEITDVRQGLILQFLGGSLGSIIDRSLVKQTVMTAVYGVTSHGAQRQIHGRLSKLAESGQLPNLEPEHIAPIARFLTSMTMEATEAQFEKCFEMMAWLKMLAKNITKHGHKLAWTTPLGLPCIQTYDLLHDDKKFSKVVSHHNQRLVMNKNDFTRAQEFAPSLVWGDEDEEMLGPSKTRQGNAFPPNFVHSLDSTHMLVTAKRCMKANVDFAAVHDSFWCHPSNVDFMSRVLREEFVALHERDLVGDLLKEFQTRYPQVPQYFEIPEQGRLNLRDVLDSPYFFS